MTELESAIKTFLPCTCHENNQNCSRNQACQKGQHCTDCYSHQQSLKTQAQGKASMVSPERFRPDQSWLSGPVGPVGSGGVGTRGTLEHLRLLQSAHSRGHGRTHSGLPLIYKKDLIKTLSKKRSLVSANRDGRVSSSSPADVC